MEPDAVGVPVLVVDSNGDYQNLFVEEKPLRFIHVNDDQYQAYTQGEKMLAEQLLEAGGEQLLDRLADRVWPVLRQKVLDALPVEVKGLLANLDAQPFDHFALAALADWVEERQGIEAGGRIRKLAVEKGDVVILTVPWTTPKDAASTYRSQLEAIVKVPVVVLHDGHSLKRVEGVR